MRFPKVQLEIGKQYRVKGPRSYDPVRILTFCGEKGGAYYFNDWKRYVINTARILGPASKEEQTPAR